MVALLEFGASRAIRNARSEVRKGMAVEVQGLTKTLGDGETKIQVLRGIDLHVQLGEMTLLVGPSGCGKTTLISIIAGLLNPTDGDVRVLGQSLPRMGGKRRTAF